MLGLVLPGVEAPGTPGTEGTYEGCIPEGKTHAYLPLRMGGGGLEREGKNLRKKSETGLDTEFQGILSSNLIKQCYKEIKSKEFGVRQTKIGPQL